MINSWSIKKESQYLNHCFTLSKRETFGLAYTGNGASTKTDKNLSLDIYGRGGDEPILRKLIEELEASDYIHLMGQHNLKIYIKTIRLMFRHQQVRVLDLHY